MSRKTRRPSTARAMIEAAVQIALEKIAANTRATQTTIKQPTTDSTDSAGAQ